MLRLNGFREIINLSMVGITKGQKTSEKVILRIQ